MKTVTVTGYLVQRKLELALREIVGIERWKGTEVILSGSRRRWDMSFEGSSGLVVVEFDGDEHYRNTLKIKTDEGKDAFARAHGIQVVRIPYWIQLTTETLQHYCSLDAEIHQDFPHGFIETKVFPASYCELGLRRFQRELESLPLSVRDAVLSSLSARALEHGDEYVLPAFLRHAA